ncbi:MAG: pantoate--beta-alanine ligase [Deltaproteobacteria bacterium CG11_big_fil_rev_8_21_14_0_20_49_13]|nr:MAG: pantoate--beta-alanine ligase [Deltaproteobacteria bacterium CG11_big_fil_rev_8_21_14_0_20_49_13]
MKIISSPKEMQELALELRKEGLRVSFVPTMGALHEGHLTLLREGRKFGDRLALSIFMNPKQFAPTEDLAKYPHDKEGDLEKAMSCGVDVVFFPSNKNMYPKGYQTYVDVTEVTRGLCGGSRPTHFRGVTTVVQKLFNIVQPNVAIFGEKDYQQLVAIRTMVKDLNAPIEIVGVPTVRESDGLAMSSRNAHLSKDERAASLLVSKGIFAAQSAFKKSERNSARLINIAENTIRVSSFLRIDYLKICDAETLERLALIDRPARILAAVFAGKTRLIDNCPLQS